MKAKAIVLPILAWAAFFVQHSLHLPYFDLLLIVLLLISTLEAVHHAELVAVRIGEPFGTLVLALAITFIEASLIIAMMMANGPEAPTLARDTVFAAVMIILNGMIGLSIIAGSIKHNMQTFVLQGVNAAITAIVAISVLTLILPNYTKSVAGPFYSTSQLVFVSLVSLAVYGSFIFIQNFKHKNIFLSEEDAPAEVEIKPTKKVTTVSLILLIVNLGAVVMLAESLAPGLDKVIMSFGAPHTLVGVIIAAIVLLPEGLSAYKAAKRNELQKSLNLSLGSALASISLTIPIVSFFAIYSGIQLSLGIDAVSTILFMLSLFITILSFSTGKTTILQGIILFVVFLVYLFTIIFP